MGCSPFVGLDGCHLKNKYKGIMLSATALDANSGLFPLAFAVVKSESGETWTWFLECLHEANGMVDGFTFMSDRDKGLESIVPLVFPNVEHRTCVRHLSHYLTNNISESFNAWINKARVLPIVEMVDTIRQKIMERMNSRRVMGSKWKGRIVPIAVKYIQSITEDIGEYEVRRSDDYKAEVVGPYFRTGVRLDERTCTCRMWQVSGIPCVHAAAFISRVRGFNVIDIVDKYFSLEKF
ncbi:hypothetical protein QJS10_CPB18g00660 [Acorus calamus]|uniref:SWIM-type domain-containing protein n=1 Tax=Acorus calamus TaxID=4465 RepID=A0AAV9CLU1_ACOCL|nr:hypothetical protein QJS10_CPB18g00660 [Acorus calamus]